MNAIEIKNLSKHYKNTVALDGISLEIREGEFFSLLGQNGAGKSTCIGILSGLVAPTDGDALVMGKSIVKDRIEATEFINVSPQETAVAKNLTVKENLVFISRIYSASKKEAEEKAEEMIQSFSLSEKKNEKAKNLSGGMQRRLSIAMALISQPKILFLDEPTLGLDVRARRDMWKMIQKLRGKTTLILTTHYLEEAEALADRIAVLDKGRILTVGTAEKIKSEAGADTLEDAFLLLTDGGDEE